MKKKEKQLLIILAKSKTYRYVAVFIYLCSMLMFITESTGLGLLFGAISLVLGITSLVYDVRFTLNTLK